MKTVLVVFMLTNGQFTETGRISDPFTDKPFATVEKCNSWMAMAMMMAASKNPEAAKKIRFECKPA